jgi:predicted CxxxxCH...CXXCH cytochrome family protein
VYLSNITSTAVTHLQPNLSALSVSVPAGSRLAVLFRWADVSTTVHSNDFMTVDNYNTTILNRIRLTETSAETTPPSWTGGVSGLTVTDPATSGELNVSWNVATDTTNPVSYRVYRSMAPDTNPLDNTYTVYGSTSMVDSGLTDGTVYYYHVKAVDNLGNVTANTDVVSGTPSAGGSSCTTCHGMAPATFAHAAHAPNGLVTECDKCHGSATVSPSGTVAGRTTPYVGGGPAPHGDGTATIYINAAYDSDSNGANNYTAATKVCTGITCHGTGNSPDWDNPATVVCGSCHGTAARNYGTDPGLDDDGAPPNDTLGVATGTRVGKHLAHVNVSFNKTGDSCNLCHLGAGKGTAAHGDGTPSGGGQLADVAFDTSAAGATASFAANTCSSLDAGNCHGNATWDSATVLTCAQCHSAIAAGKHQAIAVGGGDVACTSCHPGGTSYPTKHSKNANANVIEIPNYSAVGINYSTGGIHLGGDYTATKATGTFGARPTTEAEMCWFCHDINANNAIDPATEVSEWGTNTNGTYNEGTINQARWIGATWTSAQTASPNFSYKSGVINPDLAANSKRGSIHTAAPTGAPWNGPSANYGDTLAQIRCSYCHDVHDLNKAVGDATSGAPWLRGSWLPSPYKQDGAPQSGTTYLNTAAAGNAWGPVPRATTKTNQSLGGYWIDQNSNSPTSTWTADQFGGLCALCHAGTPGTDASWSAAEIDAINVFETNGTGWVSGLNGHANSVKGGSGAGGAAARNIYNSRGGTTTYSDNPFQHFSGMTDPGDNGSYGFRGNGQGSHSYQPVMVQCPRKLNSDEWGVDEVGGAVTNNYHQFPCSKCHTPHASRLPRLMKTNCLDTKHNSWDNNYQLNGFGSNNSSRSLSNWTSAQNCHRLAGADPTDTRADIAGTGAGWNTVTPW